MTSFGLCRQRHGHDGGWPGNRRRAEKPAEVGTLVNGLRRQATLLHELPRVEFSRDPDDNPILATAIAGGAEKCKLATDTFGFDAAIDHRAFDDARSLRKAIAATNLRASTGTISFNALGEVMKAVQNQVVKDGNWHRHSVIDDPALLAPPDK